MAILEKQKIIDQISKVITKLNEKNPYAVVFGYIFVILLIDYLFIMQLQIGTLRALNPKLTTLAQEVITTRNNIERLPQYKEEATQLTRKLQSLQNKLRTRSEFPMILKEISEEANAQGVMIDQIMPNTSAEKQIAKTEDGPYFGIPVVIEARGGYHSFGKFLNALERGNVLFKVTDFTIASNTADPMTHEIKLTLLTIVLDKGAGK